MGVCKAKLLRGQWTVGVQYYRRAATRTVRYDDREVDLASVWRLLSLCFISLPSFPLTSPLSRFTLRVVRWPGGRVLQAV